MSDRLETLAKATEEVEALLEGAIKLHEGRDYDHAIALLYIALDKVRST